jgi:hypothetical protein
VGDKSQLKPGAKIIIFGALKKDGGMRKPTASMSAATGSCHRCVCERFPAQESQGVGPASSLRLIRTSVLHRHPASVLDLLDLRHRVGEAIVSGGLVEGELKICLIAMRNFSARHYFLDIRAKEVVAMTSFPLPGSPSGQIYFFHATGSTHSCGNRGSQVR